MDIIKPLHPKLANPKPNLLEHFIELANNAHLMLSNPHAEESIKHNIGQSFFKPLTQEVEAGDDMTYTKKP